MPSEKKQEVNQNQQGALWALCV